MDDTLRNLAIGLFAFLGLHGALHEHVRVSAQRQVSEAFAGQGRVHVEVSPRGFLGLEANDFNVVDVRVRGIESNRLPFFVFPRAGWKGRIRHLRLHFLDFSLRGVHVEQFDAEIPNASFDLGHAFYRSRLVMRRAGLGPAWVRLNAADLQAFILFKYKKTLSDVKVLFQNHQIIVEGTERFLGIASFRATGALVTRDARFLDIDGEHTVLELDGKAVDNNTKSFILKLINPVLDIDGDLGLGGYFLPHEVEINTDDLTVSGQASLPNAPPGMAP